MAKCHICHRKIEGEKYPLLIARGNAYAFYTFICKSCKEDVEKREGRERANEECEYLRWLEEQDVLLDTLFCGIEDYEESKREEEKERERFNNAG